MEQVCQQLAAISRSDRQQVDTWLPTERELSKKLGVSRSVVREATKRLELQGLVEVRHGIGIKVVDRLQKPMTAAMELLVEESDERLQQLTQLRQIIEPEMARMAAAHGTDKQHSQIAATHQRLINAKDLEAIVEADLEFHCRIAEVSGNQLASLLMASLTDLLKSSLLHGYRRVSSESAIKEHGIVLNAIVRRQGASAARAMMKHLITTETELALKPTKRK